MRNAIVTLLSAPEQVKVGVPFSATFRIQNTGNEYWMPDVDKLGAWNPQDNGYWGNTRALTPGWIWPSQSADVAIATFVASAPGTFPFQWRAIREGVEWYGAASTAKAIRVVGDLPLPPPPPPPPPSVGIFPPPRKDEGDLVSAMIVNTGAFLADAAPRVVPWRAPKRLLIRAVRIWLGVDMGKVCDAHGQLDRADGSLVAVLQADHYVDGPCGAAVEHQDFGGHYLSVEAGEELRFTYFANNFGRGGNAHFTVAIWGHYERD